MSNLEQQQKDPQQQQQQQKDPQQQQQQQEEKKQQQHKQQEEVRVGHCPSAIVQTCQMVIDVALGGPHVQPETAAAAATAGKRGEW